MYWLKQNHCSRDPYCATSLFDLKIKCNHIGYFDPTSLITKEKWVTYELVTDNSHCVCQRKNDFVQCFVFSRNIGSGHPEIIYLHYHQKKSGSKYPTNIFFNLKTGAFIVYAHRFTRAGPDSSIRFQNPHFFVLARRIASYEFLQVTCCLHL